MPEPKNGYKWYHATRALGVGTILYGILVDKTPERGSIILGGFGLLGLEKVARSEEPGGDDKSKTKRKAREGSGDADSSTGD